jgi:hypothetical protein
MVAVRKVLPAISKVCCFFLIVTSCLEVFLGLFVLFLLFLWGVVEELLEVFIVVWFF